MSKPNDKVPYCWQCRVIIGIFFAAVFGMWGVICYTGKPEQGLEHWITVLIFLVTIVCTAIPLYMNNRYLELEKDLNKKIEDQQKELESRIEEQGKNSKNRIEEQRKNLESKIEEQQKVLKDEIEKTNLVTYRTTSVVYLNLCVVLCEISESNNEMLLPTANCIITTLEYMFKANIPIHTIQRTINLLDNLMSINDKVVPDQFYIKKFRKLIKNDLIVNNNELFDKCCKILSLMDSRSGGESGSGE